MNNISIIIPTCNMAQDLKLNLDSIIKSGLLEHVLELIVVDDASSDETIKLLQDYPQVEVLSFEKNRGRYEARKEGALLAKGSYLLFLDTRLEVPTNFHHQLASLMKNFDIVQGTIEIPVSESILNLYWDRSHRFLFAKHFKDQKKGFFLTEDNYEQYTSGTTIFFTKKDLFIETLNEFKNPPLSDDREVIRKMVNKYKIWVTEDLKVLWRPRQTLSAYLQRLVERGPTFVDYHFYQQKTKFALPVYVGIVLLSINFVLLVLNPTWFFRFLFLEIILATSSVIVFTRSPIEILKLMGLHLLVIVAFGLGVLKGLVTQNPWLKEK